MNKHSFSSSTLKIIAISAMVIDHFGSVVLINGLAMSAPYEVFSDSQFTLIMTVANYCHMIGRIAFPLFCFLLVEGFFHTRNLKKYATRLGLMAVLTEPIYDLALQGEWLDFSSQNVLFTLLLGLLTLAIIQHYQKRASVILLSGGLSCYLSYLLHLDGWYYGIMLIILFYVFKENAGLKYASVLGAIYLCGLDYTLQAFADPYLWFSAFSLVLIALYNGQRGLKMTYVFYFFYPVHLSLLLLLARSLSKLF